MFEGWAYSLASVCLVSALSLIGVLTLLIKREAQRDFLLSLVSLSVGGLFGDAFFHLIPDALETSGYNIQISSFILLGILTSFFVEKFLKWRHCHVPTSEDHPHSFAYMNLFGDAVHNVIDGLAIGSAYLVSTSAGVATTLAVCFHEIPQELGDFGVLIYSGMTRRRALLYNFLTALTAFIGTIIALGLSISVTHFELYLVPFAAGNFIYIAGSDLIPELHAEEELGRSILQLGAIALGILVIFLLKFMG